MAPQKKTQSSRFEQSSLSAEISAARSEIQELYLEDDVPWVVGYSGGKDSTAILQLVWLALLELEPKQRSKPIHVISTDTLVENPIVAAWVTRSLDEIASAAREQQLPIRPHKLTPDVSDTFWVNLIGRGYPAPRNKFRWCTERLKIKPSNSFILNVVRDNGEAILVLGSRKAESSKRHANIKKHARKRVRDRLVPNSRLQNCLVYTPIEDWSNDDVWKFLMQISNPWGHSNKDLLTMYRGASEDGECPLVVDDTTPSCGNSRFGCWVCTLVDQDKSMAAMIQNDVEKEWMEPLLALRNDLDFRSEDDRHRDRRSRDFRRLTGQLTYQANAKDGPKLVHGPYIQKARAEWLRKVLETQLYVRQFAPPEVGTIELMRLEELDEIRRIWVVDKHEIEDLVPQIYEGVLGEQYPGKPLESRPLFDRDALNLLRQLCDDDELHFEMLRNLLAVESRYRSLAKRKGLFEDLDQVVRRCFYDDETDALDRAKAIHEAKQPMQATNWAPAQLTRGGLPLFD